MPLLTRRGLLSSALYSTQARFPAYPFGLGVASGDPLPDGIVLWTRLLPDAGTGPVTVQWELGGDESLRTIVRRGHAIARPEKAHSVHIDVRGLEPHRPYWYRFRAPGPGGGVESPIGRTATAPLPGASPGAYRIASTSCQKYEDGFYTAWRHLAGEEYDLVLFLGDYIYEGAAKPKMPRAHPAHAAMTLADYRERYALYRSDPDLQRAHQSFPWMIVWDDHELFNDYSGAAAGRDPALRARRDAAYQAFFEHMPLRGGATRPLYRRLDIGTMARLTMLDTRRYRSPAACGGGLRRACEEALDRRRTLLGAEQERWLYGNLRSSPARWQIVAQQIPFAVVDREAGAGVSLHMDKWDGFDASRERLLRVLEERGRKDTVILTGDNHNAWVMNVARRGEGASPVATEFVCTSISSTGDGSAIRKEYAHALAENPHARYLNSRRGYSRHILSSKEWRTEFVTVPWVSKPGAPAGVDAAFVVRQGSTTVERV
jgi:alkaline phosphatase D